MEYVMTRSGFSYLCAALLTLALLVGPQGGAAAAPVCGDVDGNGSVSATDALKILRTAVGLESCELCICDVNNSGKTTATDALAALRNAVGLPETLTCPDCPPTTTTSTTTVTSTTTSTTTTTMVSGKARCTSAKFISVAGSKLDSGWTGAGHDKDLIDGASITFRVVKRCTGGSNAVCMTDADCSSGTCELTCNCDSTNNTVCEISGPTDQKHCLQSLSECSTDSDCPSGQGCENFFGPPLPLSAASTPVCVTTFFSQDIQGTADTKTGEGVATLTLRSRVHLGISIDVPCPLCGDLASNPQVGDTFSCEGGPNTGQSCVVEGVNPDFGGTSTDCPPEATSNVSGLGLAILFREVSTRTVSEQATLTCPFPLNIHPEFGNAVCTDDFTTSCSSNADCPRCTNDLSACSSNTDCSGGTCATAPDIPIACGVYCHCGFCNDDPDKPCFSTNDCDANETCIPGTGLENPERPLPQLRPNECPAGVCGLERTEECSDLIIGTCSLQSFRSCSDDTVCNTNGAGTCILKQDPCFENVITRTGSPSPLGMYCVDDPDVGACSSNADCNVGSCVDDTAEPVTVGLFCIPPTASSAINSAGGITGPGAIRFQAVVFTCRCGDGKVGCDEQCDDGNLTSGDGCDENCMTE